MCLSVCTKGSRLPLNQSGSPLQCSYSYVLGQFITNMGEGTLLREMTSIIKIITINNKYDFEKTYFHKFISLNKLYLNSTLLYICPQRMSGVKLLIFNITSVWLTKIWRGFLQKFAKYNNRHVQVQFGWKQIVTTLSQRNLQPMFNF